MNRRDLTPEIWASVSESRRRMFAVLTMYQNSYTPLKIAKYVASIGPGTGVLELITSFCTLILTYVDYQAYCEDKTPEEVLQGLALEDENLTYERLIEWMKKEESDD